MSQKPGMLECPKCGYHQPADRYCAQCGVNMMGFKKKSSLKSNPYFQFAVAAIVISVILYFVNQSAKNSLAERNDNSEDIESSYTSDFSSDEAEAVLAQKEEQRERRRKAKQKVAQNRRPKKPVKIATNKPIPQRKQLKLRVIFAEVSQSYLEVLSRDGQPGNGFGGHQSMVVKNFKSLMKKGREDGELKVVAQTAVEKIVADKAISFFEGYEDGDLEQDLGFSIQITPKAISEKEITLRFEMMRELKEFEGDTPVLVDQPFQDEFKITPSSGAFLGGVLLPPNNEIPAAELEVLSGTVLKVYNSPDFLAGGSEFVVFLQVDGFE